jgi:hypothetical protein
MSYIAIGLCDGSVVLLSGDIGRERSSKIRTLQPEMNRTPVNPVTGTFLFLIQTESFQ